MRALFLSLLLLFAAATAGCGEDAAIYATDARKANGLVIILPGIEGESEMNHGIREGLMDGGVEYALVIRPWGVPVPGIGLIVNQTNSLGNRLAGMGVAKISGFADTGVRATGDVAAPGGFAVSIPELRQTTTSTEFFNVTKGQLLRGDYDIGFHTSFSVKLGEEQKSGAIEARLRVSVQAR